MLSMFRHLGFGLISLFLPYITFRSSERIVMTSFHGRGYRGNPRSLFEHLVETHTMSPVWLSTDPALVRHIQAQYGDKYAALVHSWRGVWHLARAQAIVISHGLTDLPWLHLNRKAVLFQTFHGLPTKGADTTQTDASFRQKFNRWRNWKPVDHFLSSSSYVSDIYARRYGLPRSCFVELGYPCHDAIVHPVQTRDVIHKLLPNAPEWDHILLYTPTFRKTTETKLFPFDDFSAEALAQFLEDKQALCCLRPHPNDKLDLEPWLAISPRIVSLDDKLVPDLYTILPHCSLVLTDYSAVYIESLLTDCPSIFIPYDLDTYERGLAFDYDDMTPGAKVSCMSDMMAAASTALSGQNTYIAEQERVRNVFFQHSDGHATVRVAQWLQKRIKKQTP